MALSPLDLALTTVKDLTGNLVRSGLTTLGIFMGVSAVNATLNIEAITSAAIEQRLAQLEDPFISFGGWNPETYRSLDITPDLMQVIQQQVPGIQDISTRNGVASLRQLQYQDQSVDDVQAYGISRNYQRTSGRDVLQGRFFEAPDFEQYRAVAVIDTTLVEKLFGQDDPIGAGIYGSGSRLTVIGVVETKKRWEEQEPQGTIWVPETYASVLTGNREVGRVKLILRRLEDTDVALETLESLLAEQFPTYRVWSWGNAAEILEEKRQQETSARILKGVGVMALVIGGVGIANITMAAVMERTREIGLRRAIGATSGEVMAQFIVEAAVLSLVGGATAVVVVHFLTQAATTRLYDAPYEFSPRDAAVSMVAAFGVGVGASFFPALRVTRIDVVQAIRGE